MPRAARRARAASSCCTSSISSPARTSSGTPCSATRRPSASASWARGTSPSRNSRPRRCCSRGCSCGRSPRVRGVRVALAVLAVTVVVMGVPGWGNDFGARPLGAPGLRVARRGCCSGTACVCARCAAIAGIVVAAVVAVGLLDLLRSPDQRTHVGKFFQKVGTDFDGATLVIRRKAAANLSVLGHSRAARRDHRHRAARRLPLVRRAAHRCGRSRARSRPPGRRCSPSWSSWCSGSH